jgi:hypothetical protein
MNTKIIGYVLSGLGLIGIFLSSAQGKKIAPFLTSVPDKYLIVGSIMIIALGIVLMMSGGNGSSKKEKQKAPEVPIYEGEGKKRKIVAYQRETKK